MHDRDIVNRLDDSVVRVDAPGLQILRRARGFAPQAIALAAGLSSAPPVLAMGAQLKTAFCLAERGAAVLSQHLGDLEEAAVRDDYRKALMLYRDLFRFDPAVVAVDLHPDYASTRLGRTLADETGAAVVPVQHHHAHFASTLAEHGIAPDDDRFPRRDPGWARLWLGWNRVGRRNVRRRLSACRPYRLFSPGAAARRRSGDARTVAQSHCAAAHRPRAGLDSGHRRNGAGKKSWPASRSRRLSG